MRMGHIGAQGVILQSYGGRIGVTWGSCEARMWVISGHMGVIWGSCGGHREVILSSSGGHFKVIGGHFGIIGGSLLDHLWGVKNIKK